MCRDTNRHVQVHTDACTHTYSTLTHFDKHTARTGDTIKMPRGIAHGIFNRSGKTATCVFGVAPSRKLYDLFIALDGVTDPAELVRISALHEVDFLPPPDAG